MMPVMKATTSKLAREAGRIAQLAETKTPEEIADLLEMEESEVIRAIERSGRKLPKMIVVCQKTGRWWRVRSERGAYRMAMIKGLVDWHMEAETNGGKK